MSLVASPPYAPLSYARVSVLEKLRRCMREAAIVNPRTAGFAAGINAVTPTSDGSTNSVSSYYAFGTLTSNGTAPSNGDTVTIGGKIYTFQTSLTNSDGNVLIGASAAAALANLMNAINLGTGSGTSYAAAMTLNASASATNPTTTTLLATAKAAGLGSGGTSGASTTTTKSSATLSWTGTTLAINQVSYTAYQSATPTLYRLFSGQPFSTAGGYHIRQSIIQANVSSLTSNGTNVSNGDTVTIGGVVYTFQTTLTNSAGNVHIGASAAASLTNLFNAINATGGGVPGTDYASACVPNPYVTATNPASTQVLAYAIVPLAFVTVSQSSATLTFTPSSSTQGGGNTGLSDGSQTTAFRVEFITDAIAPSIGLVPTTGNYRFMVDGQYVSSAGTQTVATSGSTPQYITLPFATRAIRKITVEGQAGAGFLQVKVGPTEKVLQTDGEDILNAVTLWDSYGQGNQAVNLGDGTVWQFADMMGIRNMRSCASGGTGYTTSGLTTGIYNFVQRAQNGDLDFPITFLAAAQGATSITATVNVNATFTPPYIPTGVYVTNAGHIISISAASSINQTTGQVTLTCSALLSAISAGEVSYRYGAAPDVICVPGSYNDRNSNATTVAAAALQVIQIARATWPNALIIVYGVFPGSSGPSAGILAAELGMLNAFNSFADQFSVYVPISNNPNGSPISGTGTVAAPVGTGNADIYIESSGVHPYDAGGGTGGLQYHAAYMARATQAAITAAFP